MTIAPVFAGNLALQPAYSGDLATSRYTATASDGNTVTVDIIQSLPNNKGRWRHVVRCSITYAPDASGVRPSISCTFTMDHPTATTAAQVAGVMQAFSTTLSDMWDEVALGQQ